MFVFHIINARGVHFDLDVVEIVLRIDAVQAAKFSAVRGALDQRLAVKVGFLVRAAGRLEGFAVAFFCLKIIKMVKMTHHCLTAVKR